jgi:hypothetical protein
MIRVCALDIAICYIAKHNPSPAHMIITEFVVTGKGMEMPVLSTLSIEHMDPAENRRGYHAKQNWKASPPPKDFKDLARVCFQTRMGRASVYGAIYLGGSHEPRFDSPEDAVAYWEEFWDLFQQAGDIDM